MILVTKRAEDESNTKYAQGGIAASLASLRGWSLAQTAAITRANTRAALPRLAELD